MLEEVRLERVGERSDARFGGVPRLKPERPIEPFAPSRALW